ncbi:MAG: hypothetical protein PHW91_06035, partial [Bacteroidales bacterium]|nr:hypothetical protein [Bacteroidales bacterium]
PTTYKSITYSFSKINREKLFKIDHQIPMLPHESPRVAFATAKSLLSKYIHFLYFVTARGELQNGGAPALATYCSN